MVVRSRKNAKLRVVPSKQSQRATLGKGNATGCANFQQLSMLKTAAARVLARNSQCNSLATRKIRGATYNRVVEREKLRDMNLDEVNCLLVRLNDIKLYRVGDRLGWRNEPTERQLHLLVQYRGVLLELLKPRAQLRLWATFNL